MPSEVWVGVFTLAGVALGWFGPWWMDHRISIGVRGFAASVTHTGKHKVVLSGGRFGYDVIALRIVNKGRNVRISEAGFLERSGKRRFLLGIENGELPKSLSRGDDLVLTFTPKGDLGEALLAGVRLVPYCETTEGGPYRGKTDDSIERLRSGLQESQDEEPQS